MAFVHGRITVFKLEDAAEAMQDLTSYSPKVDFSRVQELLDVTTFGNTSKVWLPGYKDGDDITVELIYDPTPAAQLNAIMALTTGATQGFEYGPEGSASGKVKYSGECFLMSFKVNSAVNAATTISVTLRKSGAVTVGTY